MSDMSDAKTVNGTFKYEQDTKSFHRFKIQGPGDMTGTIYLPKSVESIPDTIILEKHRDDDNDDN